MLRRLKQLSLEMLKDAGVFELSANSEWRRRRLLILCYHGVSLDDEHAWRPGLYMRPEQLHERLQSLKEHGCSVLRLDTALDQLYRNCLPPRSVAITFDDGCYDFYKQAFPLLKHYGFPVTVYQTTYYCGHPQPVFHLICSYMLWKRQREVLQTDPTLGLTVPINLAAEPERERVVAELVSLADRQQLSAVQRDELAAKLAMALGVDYDELRSRRILQLMTADEIKELSAQGVQFQLHTHRHRTPLDASLFRKEIRENRAWLEEQTGVAAVHFCYPSGRYEAAFLPWLEQEQVISATTCDSGLASRQSNPMLLPRFVDTSMQPDIMFDSWVTGVGAWLPHRWRSRWRPQNGAGARTASAGRS